MTKFAALQRQFEAALARFEEALQEPKTVLARDAALKRFEFTFDLAWKLIRAFLAERKGVDCASPKDCIREAYRQGLIDYDEVWVSMPDWRNAIVHVYSEQFAEALYERLSHVLTACKQLQAAIAGRQSHG